MALLILFGFVAGAATALSPCVLPVLPIALSAGATGGRRRPLGIVAGLAVSFTFATVALVYVISALGLPDDLLRKLAIFVLLAFGVSLMIPPVAARLEAWLSRFAGIAGGPRSGGGDGFWSGVAVGGSLGFVYAPCAGPILAGVITVSASQSFSSGRLAVALSYGLGSAVVLYFLMLGGRRVIAPLARRGTGFQVAMGAVMVVVALAMLGNYDVKFQNRIASSLPSFLVNPSKSLEDTGTARKALAEVRGGSGGALGEATAEAAITGSSGKAKGGGGEGKPSGLPVLGAAPEFTDTQQWFNTPGDRPLTLKLAARPRRPRRLLDLQLHQLPAHAALPDRLGQALPLRRADDRRHPLARVPVRERRRQRRRSDPAQRDRIPGRAGQRPDQLH